MTWWNPNRSFRYKNQETNKQKAKGIDMKNSAFERSPNMGERVERLETTVETFVQNTREQFRSINASLDKIQDSLSTSKQTNWSVVIAAIVLGLAIWAAAIRPINQDVERSAMAASDLAHAVVLQNDRINGIESSLRESTTKQTSDEKQIDLYRTEGTPSTAARLTLLEYRIDELQPKASSQKEGK